MLKAILAWRLRCDHPVQSAAFAPEAPVTWPLPVLSHLPVLRTPRACDCSRAPRALAGRTLVCAKLQPDRVYVTCLVIY